MKIAVYHNLPSGGAKRSLYEMISRTRTQHEYSLYRPDIEANEEYMDLRELVKHEYSQGFSGLKPDVLAGKNIVAQRKFLKKFRQLESEIAQKINDSDAEVVLVMSCMFTHSPGLLTKLTKPTFYYLQEPRRQSFEFNLSALMQRLARVQKISDTAAYLARYAPQITAVRNDIQSVKAASKVLCNSYFSHEAILRNYGVDAEVCYLGVDAGFAQVKPAKKQRTNSVLIVGALHPNKNQLLMIESIGLLPDKKRLALECVYDRSEESYKQHLLERAKELGVDLTLSYRVADKELVQKYASAAAVACLAELEPFGFTPLEANLAGTPVIALKEGGYRETVIDGETGVFVSRNPQAVRDAVEKISNKKWNPTKLQAHANQWNWERTIAQYEQALQELGNG